MNGATHNALPFASFPVASELVAAGLEPRSVQFERDREGRPCARVRATDGSQRVLRLDADDSDRWTEVDPSCDEDLPLARELETAVRSWIGDATARIDVVAYRPGRRIVVGVATGERTFYVKGLRRSHARRLAAVVETLRRLDVAPHLALPVESDVRRGAFLFEEAVGPSLHQAGRDGAAFDPRGIVHMLDRFAAVPAEMVSDLPERTWHDERRSTLTLLERGRDVVPEVDRLTDVIAALDPPDEEDPVSLVHGDLHDKQIRLGSMRLIDFDTVACGSRWIDRVNLLEHVDLRVRQGLWSQSWATPWRHALAVPSTPCTRSLRTLVRARLAGVYALRPAWRTVSEELVSLVLERRSS